MTAPRPRSCGTNWAPRRRQRSPAGETVHRLGELDVALGHAAGIMGRQRHLDVLVDVEPFGVMVELLGDERDPCHEAERGVEIGKHELLADGIAAFRLAPAGKLGERSLARLGAEFLSHTAPRGVAPPRLPREHYVMPRSRRQARPRRARWQTP